MKISVMRRLIVDIDTHQIPDEFIEARTETIETEANIETLIKDWNAEKKAKSDPKSVKAEADIAGWAAKK